MRRIAPGHWPLAVKAPAVVVILMLAVSGVITQAVLDRLKDTQERHLGALSTTYLEGLASAVLPYVLREDVWEVYDVIDRSASLGGGFGRATVVITSPDGRVIAASDPMQAPLGSRHDAADIHFAVGETLVVDEADGKAHGRKLLRYQGRDIGRVFADYDIRHLVAERTEVLRTLLLTNTLLTLALAALAYWIIRRMLSPLGVLTRHIGLTVTGPLQPIALAQAGDPDSEFARLFRRYNSLIESLAEREELTRQLAAEERVASLGRLASGMAHEINNPLGGLLNAIDTLKAHGDKPAVRQASVDLIERGLRGIRDLVRTALATYRADPGQRELTAADLDDMRLLARPEIERKGIEFRWRNELTQALPLPASAVRQILLNLLLNAVGAAPQQGRVSVALQIDASALGLTIEDNGPGLSTSAVELLSGKTSRPVSDGAGTGLGLWVSRRLTVELGGEVETGRSVLGGALIRICIPVPRQEVLRNAA